MQTIEPRISAKAVDVQPAVAFAAVMLGTALFGVTGAFVSVPVVAMLLTLSDVYRKRYDLIPELTPDNLLNQANRMGQTHTGP